MAAYHLEALRRQRVIERREGALSRLAIQEEEEENRLQKEIERTEHERRAAEEDRKKQREEHFKQCGGASNYPSRTVKSKQCQARFLTQQDLRYQQKVLRDHGLVMGHVNDKFLA